MRIRWITAQVEKLTDLSFVTASIAKNCKADEEDLKNNPQ